MNTRDIRDDIMDIRSRFVRASDDEICAIVSTFPATTTIDTARPSRLAAV